MNLLQRIVGSDSPKLLRPFRAAAGYALQRSGASARLTIRRNGYRIPFFPRSNLALTLWCEPDRDEPAERFARCYLKPGDIVIDAGANIGAYAAAAATLVGPGGAVHAIEAHPRAYEALEATVRFNGFRNVVCHRVALSDRNGPARVSDLGRKDDNNHLVDADDRGLAVDAICLADLVESQRIDRIDLLKIDVEGHECAVLDGLRDQVGKAGCIHIEAIDRMLARYGRTRDDLQGRLVRAGFALYRQEDDDDNLLAFAPHALAKAASLGPMISRLAPA